MINTRSDDLSIVRKIGHEVMKEVNKRYTKLELDIDGIFGKLLLLKKKKYAALTVKEEKEGGILLKRETKGIDLVRRDWCDLSKEVSSSVLDLILSEKAREEVVEEIHDYLRQVQAKIHAGEIPPEKFVINKVCTFLSSEYNYFSLS